MFWSPGLFRSSFVWFHLCSKIWKKKGLCCGIFHNQGFTIVMSFCLATETVETPLLFQVLGLDAVWKQLRAQLLDGKISLTK